MARSLRFDQSRIYILPLAFLLLGAMAMLLFGFVGMGRGDGDFAHDMRYLFVAGEIWQASQSPYVLDGFRQAMKTTVDIDAVSFAYPPNAAPLAMTLSVGSLALGKIVIGALNLLAVGMLCLFVFVGAARRNGVDPATSRAMAVLSAAVVIGNPFTAHVIWMGQTSLISAALLYAAWMAADRRMDVAAGVLLGLAAFKPQLVVLVGLWFLLDRRWLLIVVAGATTLLMSAWPVVTTGLGGSWLGWLRVLSDYQGEVFNQVTFRHVFGLRSLLASIGIELPPLMPVAVAGVIALYWTRRHYERIWLINAVMVLAFLMLYAHDYDLAPLASLTFPLLIAARGRPGLLLLICLLACTLYFPQRIWEKLEAGDMARSREIALLGILAIYLVVARISAHAPAKAAAAGT